MFLSYTEFSNVIYQVRIFRKQTQNILITKIKGHVLALKKNCNNIHYNASKLTLNLSSMPCHSIHLGCLIIHIPLCPCIVPRFPFFLEKNSTTWHLQKQCMITEIYFALLASLKVFEGYVWIFWDLDCPFSIFLDYMSLQNSLHMHGKQ